MELFAVTKILTFAFVFQRTKATIHGIFEVAAHEKIFKEALIKLNISTINASSHFALNLSLSQFVDKGNDIAKELNGHGRSGRYVLNDLSNVKNQIFREISNHAKGNERIHTDNAFSGLDRITNHLSEVDDLVKLVNLYPLPSKGISVVVDDSQFGRASLTRIVEKCAEYGLNITGMQMISNVNKRTIFALNIHKSNVLVVDADEKKTVKIVNMVKHLGVAGYREELHWMMTTRSTGQLHRQCNLLPHIYRYIDNVPVSVSSDYIVEKIQRRNLASLNRNRNGIAGKKSTVKELNTHTRSWFTLNALTIQPEKHSHSTSKGEDLQPVVRVAIAHTTAPWVIVEEVSKTHTDRAACGRTGMLGKKFVNGTDTVKICAYGYVIDLLNLLKTKLHFEAVISTSRDGKYGSYDLETGESDGIVREVLENKADIGIDLTENKGRSKALWFSNPHLIAPIAIAYIQRSSFDESSIFGPFSNNLYIGIIGMIVGLVVIVFVIERVSPYSGFQIEKRCLVDMEDFGTLESATYVWGTLFTGEIIEKKPKSSGSRTMVLAFSFVSVVMISAYSGNLITYLVVLDETPLVSGLLDPKVGKELKGFVELGNIGMFKKITNHLSEVDDLVKFVNLIPLPSKGISVVVDDSHFGRASLTRIVKKCAEYGLNITGMQMISNVDKRTIFALNIHKSNVLVVDADEKKTVKIVNMVKHLGVAGYREELFWMMTTRSTGQLDRQCNLLPHTYRYIDNVPVSVSSDYIMEKIQRRNLASLNRNRNGITGKKPSVKELNTHTQSWFTLNTLTMQPEEHSHSTSEDLQPVVRVAIAHTTAPWVIVEEVSKTHTDQAACGRTGMLGKKFVNGTGTVKICAYGYVIDLLNLLKTKLLFEAVISTSRDGKYGSYDLETGENDGIVREVLENKADIGIDLTENKGRSKALWFSNPHLIAPMAVAYIEKNSFDESSIFGPFSNNLYIGIIGMIVGLVVIVFVTEHVSPYSGFQMKKRCLVDMEDFGTLDSATYVWGTLFTGEIIEKKPKSSGSRTMVLAFSCASVVILSAYSGNLITYLVVLDERPPISGLLDPKVGKELKGFVELGNIGMFKKLASMFLRSGSFSNTPALKATTNKNRMIKRLIQRDLSSDTGKSLKKLDPNEKDSEKKNFSHYKSQTSFETHGTLSSSRV
eukprot:gene13276-4112_t